MGSPTNNTGKMQVFDSKNYYEKLENQNQKDDERASKTSFVVEVDD